MHLTAEGTGVISKMSVSLTCRKALRVGGIPVGAPYTWQSVTSISTLPLPTCKSPLWPPPVDIFLTPSLVPRPVQRPGTGVKVGSLLKPQGLCQCSGPSLSLP